MYKVRMGAMFSKVCQCQGLQMETGKLNNFLRVSDAAKYLGVSASTLRNWDQAGKLTAVRHPVNGYRLYRLEDLQGLLNELRSNQIENNA
jgi:excisionase family DNA binding protein